MIRIFGGIDISIFSNVKSMGNFVWKSHAQSNIFLTSIKSYVIRKLMFIEMK